MPEERFRFIDLAVRPLPPGGGPSELARGELMDRLAHARPAAGDDTLAEATARLQKVSFRKFGLLAIGGLCLLVAVLVPVMKSARLELIRLNPVSPQLPYDVGFERKFEERIAAGLNKEERLFLLANTRMSEDAGVLRWLESPDDKAHPELREESLAALLEGQSSDEAPADAPAQSGADARQRALALPGGTPIVARLGGLGRPQRQRQRAPNENLPAGKFPQERAPSGRSRSETHHGKRIAGSYPAAAEHARQGGNHRRPSRTTALPATAAQPGGRQ